VAGKLQGEIRQSRPFSSLEEEAALNLSRTAGLLEQRITAVLKPSGLSPVQYNVLRILRGAGGDGAHCKDVGDRMLTPDPDVTRLLDRLEKRGLVMRERGRKDRRFVSVRITAEGLALLAGLDEPVRRSGQSLFGHLGAERLRQLIGLLEDAREKMI